MDLRSDHETERLRLRPRRHRKPIESHLHHAEQFNQAHGHHSDGGGWRRGQRPRRDDCHSESRKPFWYNHEWPSDHFRSNPCPDVHSRCIRRHRRYDLRNTDPRDRRRAGGWHNRLSSSLAEHPVAAPSFRTQLCIFHRNSQEGPGSANAAGLRSTTSAISVRRAWPIRTLGCRTHTAGWGAGLARILQAGVCVKPGHFGHSAAGLTPQRGYRANRGAGFRAGSPPDPIGAPQARITPPRLSPPRAPRRTPLPPDPARSPRTPTTRTS